MTKRIEPSDEEITEVESAFFEIYIGDIKRALRIEPGKLFEPTIELPDGGAKLAALVMANCIIEVAGRFKCGGTDRNAFEGFAKYMQTTCNRKYDGAELYDGLRCGLVHSLNTKSNSGGPSYTVSDNPYNPLTSLSPTITATPPNGYSVTGAVELDQSLFGKPVGERIALSQLLADLETTLKKYFVEIKDKKNTKLRETFYKGYKEIPLLKIYTNGLVKKD